MVAAALLCRAQEAEGGQLMGPVADQMEPRAFAEAVGHSVPQVVDPTGPQEVALTAQRAAVPLASLGGALMGRVEVRRKLQCQNRS